MKQFNPMWEDANKIKYDKQHKQYSQDDFARIGKQKVAHTRLRQAVANGTIQKKTVCETCGKKNKPLVAHHWNGYDKPFDVWWVCHKCNVNLPHHFHLELKDAPGYLKKVYRKRLKKQMYYFNWLGKQYTECEVCGVPDKGKRMIVISDVYEPGQMFICHSCHDKAFGE